MGGLDPNGDGGSGGGANGDGGCCRLIRGFCPCICVCICVWGGCPGVVGCTNWVCVKLGTVSFVSVCVTFGTPENL